MVAILVIGLLGLALIWWHNQQALAAGPPPDATPNGGPVYSPKAPPQAESIIISSIPVIGPIANYTVAKAGNAIIQNKFLEQHSQIGPNPGQTAASAGILSLNKTWTYTQVGHGIKTAAVDTKNFITSGKIVKPWDW